MHDSSDVYSTVILAEVAAGNLGGSGFVTVVILVDGSRVRRDEFRCAAGGTYCIGMKSNIRNMCLRRNCEKKLDETIPSANTGDQTPISTWSRRFRS
jgi:hypothetical protein